MANLTITLPHQTRDIEHDFNELFSWANRLVAELRTLVHTLDSSNIRSLSSDRLTGMIDASRVGGTAREVNVDSSGGVTLTDEDGNTAALISCTNGDLHIDAVGDVYINGNIL